MNNPTGSSRDALVGFQSKQDFFHHVKEKQNGNSTKKSCGEVCREES
ncbi:hypothetical protein IMCC9480_277 [Oxalobacteraceae bacterium IMCC9480]|nr:hypothetical protein IMCC9480_277 [Oxalobacteraceae bacterium IMCC9480]